MCLQNTLFGLRFLVSQTLLPLQLSDPLPLVLLQVCPFVLPTSIHLSFKYKSPALGNSTKDSKPITSSPYLASQSLAIVLQKVLVKATIRGCRHF